MWSRDFGNLSVEQKWQFLQQNAPCLLYTSQCDRLKQKHANYYLGMTGPKALAFVMDVLKDAVDSCRFETIETWFPRLKKAFQIVWCYGWTQRETKLLEVAWTTFRIRRKELRDADIFLPHGGLKPSVILRYNLFFLNHLVFWTTQYGSRVPASQWLDNLVVLHLILSQKCQLFSWFACHHPLVVAELVYAVSLLLSLQSVRYPEPPCYRSLRTHLLDKSPSVVPISCLDTCLVALYQDLLTPNILTPNMLTKTGTKRKDVVSD